MPKIKNNKDKRNGKFSVGSGFCAYTHDNVPFKKDFNKIDEISSDFRKSPICWIDYIVSDVDMDAMTVATEIGFSENLVGTLLNNKSRGYEDFGNEMGVLIPAIIVHGFDVVLSPLMILINSNTVLTIHTTEVKRFTRMRRYAETFMKKLPASMPKVDKITLLLVRLIDENNSRNFEHLLEIEQHGDKLSERLANPKTPRDIIGKQIHEMKHALVSYLGGLWATVDVLSSVRYGDADLLTDDDKILDKITALLAEVNSHIGLAEHLSEVLASGLEVVQSIYNNQLQVLNNKLALVVGYLTIVGTAFMVPNTIATALGSSAFQLGPEDVGWYLTLLVISTIISTIIAWYVVYRMGLLPKKPDTE